MSLHSAFNDKVVKPTCGFCQYDFRKGQAKSDGEADDIIDEAIKFYRVNIFFKNYEILGPADRLLIYLIVYINHLIKTVEKDTDGVAALKKMIEIAKKPVPKPSEPKFFMNSIFNDAKSPKESDDYQTYLKEAKEETAKRLIPYLFDSEGRTLLFKYWVGLSKRKFMGYDFS
mmetsp:Transcript_34006/g.30785  ORF Transcript_34006/g.30785 Transcript_34006/m.30785 type:complete len:172 (+) Transcript_34006:35-550(+)